MSPVHFALIIFGDGVSRTICPGWPRTMILPISASQLARITGVSHWHPANTNSFKVPHVIVICTKVWDNYINSDLVIFSHSPQTTLFSLTINTLHHHTKFPNSHSLSCYIIDLVLSRVQVQVLHTPQNNAYPSHFSGSLRSCREMGFHSNTGHYISYCFCMFGVV
jgi:hypothetical protein